MKKNILFVCQSGKNIGLGHMNRSLVAAKSLQDNSNLSIKFVIFGDKINKISKTKFPVEQVNENNQKIEEKILTLLQKRKYSILCLDLFEEKINKSINNVISFTKNNNIKLVVIGALRGFESFTDLLFFPSFVEPANYEALIKKVKVVYGWDCYLLNVKKDLSIIPQSKKILILTGGSDVTKLGLTFPNLLNEKLPKGYKVDWVTGPFSDSPNFPKKNKISIKEHIAPTNLSNLMCAAKIAITLYGVAFFELVAMGIPAIVFSPYGTKDSRELNEISKLGIAIVVKDEKEAIKTLKTLLNSKSLQKKIKQNSKKFMRNFNGERFSKEINSLLINSNSFVS